MLYEVITEAVSQAEARRSNPFLAGVRLERWREGPCVQIMHVGPYAEWMDFQGITRSHVLQVENSYTAQAFV